MLWKNKIKSIIMIILINILVFGCAHICVSAEGGYITVNDDSTQYASLDEAVSAASAVDGKVTYHIYGSVTACGTTEKYTPDTALGGTAESVNIVGETTDAKITLSGVYYQRFAAENAKLSISNVILDDDRDCSGEGNDPDPWEFTYLQFECASAEFLNCTFYEGVLVDIDTLFENCNFSVKPEFYRAPKRTFSKYTEEQIVTTDWAVDHYALWISNYGNVVVKNCSFTDIGYGGIKSTWNRYGTGSNLTLMVINTAFTNVGVAGEHAPIHLDGAAAITVEDSMFVNCATNDNGEYINCKTEDTPISESRNLENGYHIDYELGEGTSDNPVSYDGKTDIILSQPVREGYTFIGWTNENITIPQKEVVITAGTIGRLSFKANWEKATTVVVPEEIPEETPDESPQEKPIEETKKEIQDKNEITNKSPKTGDNVIFSLSTFLGALIVLAFTVVLAKTKGGKTI